MKFMDTLVHVDASQPQHVPAGKLLGKMYYGSFLESVLSRDEYYGYPHNGGTHSLTLVLTPKDLRSFLSLVQEHFVSHPGVADFVATVKAKFAQKYPSLQTA
jgi:hypothetical protein